jgi:hypothetical protein
MIFFNYGQNITSIAPADRAHGQPFSRFTSCPINMQSDISYGAFVVPVIYPDTQLSAMLHIRRPFQIGVCAYQV